ncbi:MAG: type VI secretion system tip protein VgrG [Pseudomonadota bacterium]|nr:type VI secretion system tip protein VgrG [Pseudomonadota bacterium]
MSKVLPEADFLWSGRGTAGKTLEFRRMRGVEELGRLPSYEVELLHAHDESQAIEPDELLGKTAAVRLRLDTKTERHFNGFVSHFELDGTEENKDLYRVTLRPWLWFLTLSSDCRIFHRKTVVEILELVFKDYQPANVKKQLKASYRKREFCVQYRESDFAFVSRLMESEGIFYYFEHTESGHTLVLCDGGSELPAVPGKDTLLWAQAHHGSARSSADDTILRFRRTHGIHSTDYAHGEYDYETPAKDLKAQAQRTVTHARPKRLSVFEYPGGYHDHAEGGGSNFDKAGEARRLADIRAGAFKLKADVATGLSRARTLAVGHVFKLDGHGQAHNNIKYKIVHTEIQAEFGGADGGGDRSGSGYSCRFEAIPAEHAFQPERITPAPLVPGSQTALVVGGSEDEILTEKLGRVKVKFMWDRSVKGGTEGADADVHSDSDRSCWVRVSHPWAGKKFGMIALPRVGDEVVVDFLDGDPDRPIIVGRVYNAVNEPPYVLPANATVSGIKTHSSKDGADDTFNELRFDDKKGSEYIWFQAQKDFHRLVKNDAWDEIAKNATATIGENYLGKIGKNAALDIGEATTLKVGKDTSITLGADCALKIGGDLSLATSGKSALKLDGATALTTGADVDLKVGGSLNISADGTINIKCMGLVIDAGMELSLKAGGSFVVLNAAGVAVSGTLVQLNSGGSASAPGAAKPASPAAPQDPAAPPEHKDPMGSGSGG